MEIIKNYKQARERVEDGKHLYLISFTSRTNMVVGNAVANAPVTGSFVLESKDEKALWEIYYILQDESLDQNLDKNRDANGLLAISNIVKLT